MVNNGKKPHKETLRENVPRVEAMINAADTMNTLSIEELKKRSDSLIENIGALRFSIARIDQLDGYRHLLRDLLQDCRIIVAAHEQKTLVRKIDAALRETEDG